MTAPQTQSGSGTPSPNRWIHHETIKTDSKALENVAPLHEGATLTAGVVHACVVTCAGASRARVRMKASVGGELKIEFCRPRKVGWAVEVYTVGNPPPSPVVADTEMSMSTDEIAGEAQMRITFVPDGAGVVNWLDFMAL